MAWSVIREGGRRAEAAEEGGGITRESTDVPVEPLAEVVRGDTPKGVSINAGESDREPALKWGKETEGRRVIFELPLSLASLLARPVAPIFAAGSNFL